MAYVIGVLVLAFAILLSVSLHEAGHMGTAKMFGMKVTRYFVGFGPTLWSFRRGETEYGVKAIPLGGFVKIVGMTPQDDDVAAEDESRAMWRYAVWKRTIVMSAGSATHFALAFIGIYVMALFVGLPNPAIFKPAAPLPAYVAVSECIVVAAPGSQPCTDKDPVAPAKRAGLETGDKITALDGQPVNSYDELRTQIRKHAITPAQITFERGGVSRTVTVDLMQVQRVPGTDETAAAVPVAAMGVAPTTPPGVPMTVTYGPIAGLGASADFGKDVAAGTFGALKQIPAQLPALWSSITGGERSQNSMVSVVGVTRIGGDAAEHNDWQVILYLFISLNIFVGIFNLLPLLPLDGGHIAIAWFEKARSWVYARFGRRDPGRVDYAKLMPITYVIILLFGGLTLLTVTADIINPIRLF